MQTRITKDAQDARNLFKANVRALTDEAINVAMTHRDPAIRRMAERESLRRERAAERFISWCMH